MKKVLVVSAYAPPSTSGSGLMMYNLFSFFPSGSLVILTSEDNKDVKLERYRLPVPYYFYGSEALSMKFNERQETRQQKLKRALKNFPLTKFFAQFILLWFLPRRIIKKGIEAARKENANAILAYSDFGPNLFGAYLLHKKLNLPLYIHFYDMYVGNKLPLVFKFLAKYLEPRLFKSAKGISVMCEELEEHYKNKYARPIEVIHNSIIINKPPTAYANETKAEEPRRIVYIGSIYWAQEGAVKNLVEAVDALGADLKVELYLYTPHSKEYLAGIGIFESNRVKFTYCLPDEVSKVMTGADLLFVGLAFNTAYPELINTSSPGKLCEYLISGRPILVHAPKESFLSKYARKEGFAVVVDEDSSEILRQAIENFALRPETFESMIAKAFKTALKNHQAETTARKLIALLT